MAWLNFIYFCLGFVCFVACSDWCYLRNKEATNCSAASRPYLPSSVQFAQSHSSPCRLRNILNRVGLRSQHFKQTRLGWFNFVYFRNLQMIFRNSSFTSFIIHESLLVIGQSYLHKVLLRAVERIVAEGRSCEIDPARLKLSNGSSLPRSFEGVSPNSQDVLRNNKVNTFLIIIYYWIKHLDSIDIFYINQVL